MTKFKEQTDALLVQRHQQTEGEQKLGEIEQGINELKKIQSENLDDFDELDAQLDALMAAEGIVYDPGDCSLELEVELALDVDVEGITARHEISLIKALEHDNEADWGSYIASIRSYASENGVNLEGDPFARLMTESQRIEITKRINDDLTYKKSNCDKYDYMIAATCGMVAGLVDVFFIGLPGTSKIGEAADKTVDSAVMGVSKLFGWKGPRDPEGNSVKSAVGYLERNYSVNYDQALSNSPNKKMGTSGQVKNLTPKNHHIKSLGHSPDLIGLLFSIINQFTSTSTFVSDGRLITIDTETFELKGNNFPAKVFAGFCNWLGHIASDMAGSSGSKGRGAGVPIPFYSLLQFIDVGSFGQHRDTFAKVAVKVFEEGYDLRHGVALAVPVLIAELMTRLAWTFKQKVYHQKEWNECIPTASNPELRRMLLVAHGTLCLVDGVDAGLRSGGNIVQFMLRSNILAWARFGTLAIKELRAWYKVGHIDIDAANEHLDKEYAKLLENQL